MARTSSNDTCVHVGILDDEGNVIGVAHASGYINNDKFVDLPKELNELTEYDGRKFIEDEYCAIAMCAYILNRIRNLRGETHDC